MQPKDIAKKLNLDHFTENARLQKRNTYKLDEAGNIIGLNLSGNGLSGNVLEWLWACTVLEYLDISKNKLTAIEVPEKMSSLKYLDVSGNKSLQKLVFEGEIPVLETLELSQCSLPEIYIPVGEASGLKDVYASQNKLKHFAISGHCPKLRFLDLSRNALEEIQLPEKLPTLQFLFLQGGNRISDIGFLENMLFLQTLNLSENPLKNLETLMPLIEKGVFAKWKKKGNGILLEGCPLEEPSPEIVKKGNKAILNYFQAKKEQGVDVLYEAKVLIVGEGGSGKTSLCRRLLEPACQLPEEEKTTKGIAIHAYDFSMTDGGNFRANIWDFGGQEIYHATHQFFLTKRSLYILLDDTRKDYKTAQDKEFRYWLGVIDLLSDGSPVLIFQNEKGGRSKMIDWQGIKVQFDNVKELYKGDLKKEASADSVGKGVKYYAQQLPHIGQKLPKKWIAIRKEIEALAKEKAYISCSEYFTIYEKHLPFDKEKALFLSQYFHDLGVFLHFQEHELLCRTIILKNTWATEAVFKVLDSESVKTKRGRFNMQDCSRIWKDSVYADKHLELRTLMEEFELCYRLRDSNPPTWLAPKLLPPSKPEALMDWEKPGDLVMVYEYHFLPKGMINRLMVRQHRFVPNPELGWQTGVFFEQGDTALLVQLSDKGDEIIFRARGAERKELLNIIAAELDALNATYEDLPEKIIKKVPCICKECLAETTPEFYTYKELKKRQRKEVPTIECRASYAHVSVGELLEGVEGDIVKMEALKKTDAKKIFISYSKEDREYLEELQKHLAPLYQQGKVQPFNDHDVLPGEDWDHKIKKELEAADIILFLLSPDALVTEYIRDVEIKIAMARREKELAVVVPVIIRHCDWEETELSALNALPGKGSVVKNYEDRDEAWQEVVAGIKRLL